MDGLEIEYLPLPQPNVAANNQFTLNQSSSSVSLTTQSSKISMDSHDGSNKQDHHQKHHHKHHFSSLSNKLKKFFKKL
ncbi:hypothetical protein CONCODRAFT_80723 [Conidiobolus coronatus NRRL 28638]|uniref:Uncharacterized protein n=1 Tax=Conidiobolus coronatus (strain ATCC 28846 / CBS 209.66 / NRRL 28638) TaxID=796925 RepID=A0A137NSE8_CONC2|nr:hypothetical protein CONCODRAFT_80723 [Conidiobolus coronatus NRRL 28638]|eukprot:KXN65610.1 hypothetical protein CONCODRAFT_80723 [Conidiobolus coronatus NRRL 28638]